MTDHIPEAVAQPSHAEIRQQIGLILSSPQISKSPRLRQLFLFTCDRALKGDSASLKEYVLGIEVFGKPASFDPRLDTIVRVQARRLRNRIKEYYNSTGVKDPVVIKYEAGCYAPKFSRNLSANQKRAAAAPDTVEDLNVAAS
ncbi:MAG: hypothetical protein IRZ15_12450 [Bryobacteraceae bacterium]|nr:hypothetical protein [Bryobacteraceae bacterium]